MTKPKKSKETSFVNSYGSPANGGASRDDLRGSPRQVRSEDVSNTAVPSHDTRTVFIGGRFPPSQEVVIPEKFPDNRVITSKYTTFNFIPKNLFEQFRRIANVYFLIICIIQFSIDSPVDPLMTTMPLVFVVSVTAIKQAYEDWLRHKADNEENNKEAAIVKDGKLIRLPAKDIKVGDVVVVYKDESFPCDLVMLSSADKEGKCHVTTANLDGETNLKVRKSVSQTKMNETVNSFSTLIGKIECQQPDTDLYKFMGRITIYTINRQKTVRSLNIENVLLKGARLKNTAQVFGCAVYTGQETKMSLNSRVKSNKFSTIEKSMNRFLAIFLVVLIVETAFCTALRYYYIGVSHEWYISSPAHFNAMDFIQTFFSFLILFNYIIPISLYVTVELQKFFGSMFFVWDEDLYDEKTDQCAKCNSSDLNEELGQVEYLFSDKTGTLTENEMLFRQCSIAGDRYEEYNNALCAFPPPRRRSMAKYTKDVELFLLALSICHTVQISDQMSTGNNPEFQASSPDEKALIEACYRFGVEFKGVDNNNTYEINFRGKTRFFKCLHILEFTPERRCMSVIVRDESVNVGDIYLFCKGAEMSVFKKCSTGAKDVTVEHVDEYAVIGLRTLVVAYKTVSPQEYELIDSTLKEAANAIHDREEKTRKACLKVEHSLHLLGAVGVEDKLQQGVQDTLESLEKAGVKVWVLTGDKMQTAINISYSCKHFKPDIKKLMAVEQTHSVQCKKTLTDLKTKIISNPENKYGLVIDGSSIAVALSPECVELFVDVSSRCNAVVCCRMSPIQKAEIVKAVKSSAAEPVTAAVGDGANDCSMIQEAHVGIGIMGKEGRQAMRCSDFAISRFKFIKKMLLVHGHFYYMRVSSVVQYFFYKNVAFNIPQLYFAFFNAFSTQTLYDALFMTCFNIIFTSVPILIFGLFEQNIKPEVLLQYPHLYRNITRNARLSLLEFLKWNLFGIWHSLVFFFGAYFLLADHSADSSAQIFGYAIFGSLVFHLAVIVINLKLFVESRFFTVIFVGAVLFSNIVFMLFATLYSAFNWAIVSSDYQLYDVYIRLLEAPSSWILLALVIIVALIPDVVSHVTRHHYSNIKNSLNSYAVVTLQEASETMPLHSSIRSDYTGRRRR